MGKQTLKSKVSMYNSVEVLDEAFNSAENWSNEDFSEILEASIEEWTYDGRIAAFIELPGKLVKFIPIAYDKGFEFHHAHNDYVMMFLRLSESANIPRGPIHVVGVGGLVVRCLGDKSNSDYSNFEILVIQEKHGPSAKIKDFWKVPGGLVDQDESIAAAAVREVKEETGVDCVFKSFCCFREHFNGTKAKNRKHSSEIYAICLLELVDDHKREIKIQESEIAAAQWMNLEDFLNSSIYKSRRDPFSKLTRAAIEVAVGKRLGFDYDYINKGSFPQSQFLPSKI